MKKIFVLMAALLVFGLLVAPAGAQEQTGTLQGTLTDASGAALPGVTVKAISAGSAKQTQTDASGKFRLPGLPPGTYELTASLEGFATQQVPDIDITLGDILTVDMQMQLSAVAETILVTSEAPIIEITKSATEQSISGDMIDKLPRGRNFASVVTQAAHANNEDDGGGIMIDGSSGSENRFVVDGMDTTDLQTGESAKNVLTDHIQEVQVKSSGYAAEYGGSTGGVISVVTKTGTNNFRGSLGYMYEDDSMRGDHEQSLRRNPDNPSIAEYVQYKNTEFSRSEPGFTLGGPIMKDRMYFFASYAQAQWDRTRTNEYGGETGTRSFDQTETRDYIATNISGTIGSSMSYKLSANIDDYERDNTLPDSHIAGDSDPHDADLNYDLDEEQPNRSFSGHYDWLVNQNVALSARAGHFEYDENEFGTPTDKWLQFSTGSAGTPQDLFPGVFPEELQRPWAWRNISSNIGTKFDLFERDTIDGDLTYYASDFGGEHTFKVGVQVANIHNEVLRGYQNTRVLIYWGRGFTNLEGVYDPGGAYGSFRLLQIATQGNVDSDNLSLFLQDSWRPTSRLTLNIGVRVEEEKVPSYAVNPNIPDTAIDLGFGDKLAPRLGFAYDVKGDGDWKLWGSYGKFYDITKLEMPRGSFGGDKWVDHFFALDAVDWLSVLNDPNCTIGPENGLQVPNCNARHMFSLDQRHPSNDPNDPTIDPNLQPMESTEYTLGVEHQLSRKMSVGLRYVHKQLDRTIEDVGVNVPGIGTIYYISNPGEGIATHILGPDFPSQPKAKREYDGFELDFRMRATKNWTVHASYLYSKLYGNYSGLASSDEAGRNSPNVNRFFDGLPMNFDASGSRQPVYGRLGTDRPHQFKAQVIYNSPWETSFGLNQYIASGTPISTQMNAPGGLPFFPYGRGDLGRTDTLNQTDLYIAHPIRFGDRYEVELTLNILNLFDQDAAVNVDSTPLLENLPLSNEEFFAGFDPNAVIAQYDLGADPRFLMANDFQNRREIRLGVHFRF